MKKMRDETSTSQSCHLHLHLGMSASPPLSPVFSPHLPLTLTPIMILVSS